MKRSFRYLLLIPFFLLTGAFRPVTDKSLLGDFNILEQTFRELHPALYNVIGKKGYDDLVAEIRSTLANTTDRNTAMYLIQDYIYRLGDGHASTLDAFFEKDFERILPFKVAITDTQLYIRRFPAHPEQEGVSINSINGTPVSALIDSLSIFFCNDGARHIHSTGLSALFNSLYARFCGQPGTFLLGTDRGAFAVPAMQKDDSLFQSMIAYDWIDPAKEQPIFADSISFGYARFNNFLEVSNKMRIEEKFNHFIDDMISKKREAIVIDLRYNDGGLPVMATRMAERITDTAIAPVDRLFIAEHERPAFASFLSHYPNYFFLSAGTKDRGEILEKVRFEKTLRKCRSGKPVFTGKVYVLVSDVTASAATMFCSLLQGNQNVIFIGSETGGAINYFWAHKLCQMRLPESGINITFPLELVELKNGSSDKEKPAGLVPDVKISYTISDYLAGRDREIEYVNSLFSLK